MSGALQAVFQNQRSFGTAASSQSFLVPGNYCWVAPAGVTSVSVVAIGGGGGGTSGSARYGGGGLAYKNNMTVIPGNSYPVAVGAGGVNSIGGCSYGVSSCQMIARGGGTGTQGEGNFVGDGGGKGGKFGNNAGGGAGGYSGQGGMGGDIGTGNAGLGGGGGGGGGGNINNDFTCRQSYFGAGGGVGIFGSGSNGTAGTGGTSGGGGGGGSGGSAGGTTSAYLSPATGGLYGGAGGSSVRQSNYLCAGPCCSGYQTIIYYYGAGAGGAVRIVWPGNTRTFPSTCVGSP
jgi:hypothetical protein